MFIRNNTLSVQTKSGHYVKNGKLGSPDFLVWMPEGIYQSLGCLWVLRGIAIECKSDIGKQSADQIKWQADFEKLGGEYYVVRSVDEIIKIIEKEVNNV